MSSKWSEYGLKTAGGVVTALGIVVLVGWATHTQALLRLIPISTEMRRITALGLLVCGLGMIALASKRRMPALLSGAFCALLGLLSAVECAFGVNLRIDDLLGKSYFPGQSVPYGRMSPITTVCFMLAGSAMLCWSWKDGRRLRSWFLGILTSVLAAIGLVSSMGYIFGNTDAYGWSDLTRIAFNTALAFALVGTSLLIFVWSEESELAPSPPTPLPRGGEGRKSMAASGWRLPEWLPLSAGIGVLTATLGVWQALMAKSLEEQPILSEIVLASGVILSLLLALTIHLSQREKGSPETTMLAGFGLAFATLVVVGAVQHRSIQTLVETDAWVEHTRAVRTELEGVCAAMLEGETGTRGYVVTGLPDYIAQQQAGISRSVVHLRAVRSLIADNPRQQRNVDRLELMAARKTAMMHYLAGLRRDQGFATAQRYLNTEEPLRLMNDIRTQVDVMEAEESGLLETRQAASRASARRSNAAVAFGTLLALAFVLAAGWITRRDAIKREHAERELRDSEGRLGLALDAAQMGVWELDLVNDTSIRSLRHDQIFGYPSIVPDWGYKTAIAHVHPEDRDLFRNGFNEARVSDHLAFACRINRADDGSLRWIAVKGRLYRNDQGDPIRIFGVVSDITERKRAEEELRRSRQEWEEIFQAVGQLAMILDPEQRIIAVNRATLKATGMSQAELVGQKCYEVFHATLQPPPNCPYEKMSISRCTETCEMEVQILDRMCLVSCTPVFDEAHKLVKAIHLATDITDRKRAEEALRESETKYRTLVESLPQKIAYEDRNSVYISCNRNYARDLKIGPQEIAGKTDDDFFPRELAEKYRADDRRVMESGVAEEIEEDYTQDGETRLVSTVKAPVRNERGEVMGVVLIFWDITERKRAEESLRRLNRALKTISECNQALVQAHEEKSLLQNLCGILVQEGGYRLAWVGYPEQDAARTVRPAAHAGIDEGYLANARISWGDNERGRGPTGKAIRFATPVITRQTAAEPEYEPWRADAVRRGFASSIALPLIVNAVPMGALMVYSGEPDAFDEDELRLLTELANDLAFGIQALRTRAEHQRAEVAVQESEAAFRTLANAMPQMVWMCLPDGMNVYFNDRWVEYTGLTLEESHGRGWNTPFHPDDKQAAWDAWNHATATGDTYRIESRLRAADGSYRWFLMRGVPMRDAAGQIVKWFGTCTDIHDLKEGEESLRKATEAVARANSYNRSLLEASLDPLVTIAPDGKITDVNAATGHVTGHSREELIGTDFSIYFTDPERARAGYQQVFREGWVQDYELEVRRRDGHITPVLYNASHYRDETGEVAGVFAAARDITERKRVQERVAAERQRFNKILDVMPAYVVLLTPDYHVPFANRYFEERFGKSHGKRCFDYLFGRSEPCEVCNTYDVLKTHGPVQWYWTGPDGRDYDIHDYPFTDSDGSSLILEMGIDITEQNRAQEALRRAGAYNRSLLEASLDPLVTIAPDGKITDVNAATEHVTGHSREELIGTDFSDYFTDSERARAGYQQVFREGWVQDYELEVRRGEEQTTPVIYNASLYRDEKGEIVGVFAAARDITERRRSEEEIRRLNASLERRVAERTAELTAANRELDAFSYSASHDLRAPLRAMDGFCQALMEDHAASLDAEGKHYLERVRGASQRMEQLIDGLLGLSRMARSAMRRTAVNLSALAENIAEDLKASSPGREVECVVAPGLVASADANLIRVALQNLLGNAWKYTGKHARARIEVGSIQHKGQTAFFVRDDGAGFDMRYADKLFGAFQRLHTPTDFEGTGIGLATLQRIVHRHGGTVWAEAEVEKGATFYFTLPGEVDQTHDDEVPPDQSSFAGVIGGSGVEFTRRS